jgi:putative hydrolase of the HAD superfamily
MPERAVTVDFWGTLVIDSPGFDEHYRRQRLTDFQRILAAAGSTLSLAALDRAYEAAATLLGDLWAQSRDLSVQDRVRAVFDAADRALAARLPASTLADLVEAYSRPATLAPPTADPAAAAGLERLRAFGYALCVVSNTMRTPGTTLRRVLDHHGLLSYFSALTFSDECGIRKPDPEIFALTLRAVSVSPTNAIHVGDDPTLDVAGARAAGLRVVRVARESAGSDDPEPDATIADLSGLADAVLALDRRA